MRDAVCESVRLHPHAMVIARGRMGERIADAVSNLYKGPETVWECGYSDGDEVRAAAQHGTGHAEQTDRAVCPGGLHVFGRGDQRALQ